jgi:DNA-binding XRE family transcriptional regulator
MAGRTLGEKIAGLPKARRAKVRARTAELIAEELSLQAMRKALGRTQVALARELGVGQDTVSRIENRTDLMLSTLARYVKALGGELEIVARFEDRAPVRLHGLAELRGARAATE